MENERRHSISRYLFAKHNVDSIYLFYHLSTFPSVQQTLHSFCKIHDFYARTHTHIIHASFYFFLLCYYHCCLLCNNWNKFKHRSMFFFFERSLFTISFFSVFCTSFFLLLIVGSMCRFGLSTYLNKHWHWIFALLYRLFE